MRTIWGHSAMYRSWDTLTLGPSWVSSVTNTTVGLHSKPYPSRLQSRMCIPSSQGTLSDLHTPLIGFTPTTESLVSCRLTLMTYYGVVLLLVGYQANETHVLKQYKAIVEKLAGRFPLGSLWILNRVNIPLRCSCGHLNILLGKDPTDVI